MSNQNRFYSAIAALGIAFSMLLVPSVTVVRAQPSPGTSDSAQQGLNDVRDAFPAGARQTQDLRSLIRTVINWALYFAAIVAVFFIIYGGFQYITSAGDSAKAGKGRTTLTNALIGLVIVVLSYLMVQVVYNFLTR